MHAPHNFLSAIFGIFGKFWIDIDIFFFENFFFSRWKFFSKTHPKKFWRLFWKKSQNFKISKFLDFESLKNLTFLTFFLKKHFFFSKKYFFWLMIFWSRKLFLHLFFPISIRKFPTNPKIILKKSYGESKYPKMYNVT